MNYGGFSMEPFLDGRIRIGRPESSGNALGTVAGLGLFLWTRGFIGPAFMRACLVLGMIAVFIVLAAWIRALRPQPTGMEAT